MMYKALVTTFELCAPEDNQVVPQGRDKLHGWKLEASGCAPCGGGWFTEPIMWS